MSGSLDAGWSKAGGGEEDDERGVCWLRLLSFVACCRAVLSVVGEWG